MPSIEVCISPIWFEQSPAPRQLMPSARSASIWFSSGAGAAVTKANKPARESTLGTRSLILGEVETEVFEI